MPADTTPNRSSPSSFETTAAANQESAWERVRSVSGTTTVWDRIRKQQELDAAPQQKSKGSMEREEQDDEDEQGQDAFAVKSSSPKHHGMFLMSDSCSVTPH